MRLILALILLLAALPVEAITIKKQAERKKAPDFELKDASGRIVRLSDYKGKVVLLDFWATWCGPCKAEIPWLNDLSRQYEAKGVVVLGISMDEDRWDAVKPFLEKVPIAYPVLMGTRRVAYLYGDVEGLPVAFFIDRDQRVAAIQAGAASRKNVEQTLKALLAATQ
ncbi:MAG TPA: TlpA disulfide reductase family protein [Paludibaculum sp.]|jgi:cytochrome c biogenesis protein CcmG/thiol:disulfide interchange protein DsbE